MIKELQKDNKITIIPIGAHNAYNKVNLAKLKFKYAYEPDKSGNTDFGISLSQLLNGLYESMNKIVEGFHSPYKVGESYDPEAEITRNIEDVLASLGIKKG